MANAPQARRRRSRGAKPSPLQKEMVAKLMEANPALARGRLVGPEAAQRAANLWRAAAKRLNASGGSIKTWKEWRKYWSDKKAVLKGLAFKRLQHTVEAEDDSSVYIPSFGDWEERMLAVLGDGFGQPTPDDDPGTLSSDVDLGDLGTTSNEPETSPHHTVRGFKDSLFEEGDEKWEWYEERNDDEEFEDEDMKTNLKMKFTRYLSKSNGIASLQSPEPRLYDRDLINQSNQSFGMFIANELQQYESVERYDIMKKIIDIFIKK